MSHRRCVALILILSLLGTMIPFTTAMAPDDVTVAYEISNSDFTQMTTLPDSYATVGGVSLEQALVMEKGSGGPNSGGAAWCGLPVSVEQGAPQVGDLIHARIQLYISADATPAAGIPILKIHAGGKDLLHLTDMNLADVPRGQLVSLSDVDGQLTQHWYGTIPAEAAGGYLQAELHNDMTNGTVEIVSVEVWTERGGEKVIYNTGNVAQWDKAPNSGVTPYVKSALVLPAGAKVTRTVIVDGSVETAPHVGDLVRGSLNSYVGDGSVLVGKVTAGEITLATGTAEAPVGQWITSPITTIPDGSKIPVETTQMTWTMENTGTVPVRVHSFQLSGNRSAAGSSMDFNHDGVLNEADATYLEDRLAEGSLDLAYDFDGDGQFTAKDISHFRKFTLNDPGEFYLNLAHLNFLCEEVTIDGRQMSVVNLYAEPNDRTDLSKGYHYVGDPQEGFACVDDAGRAVVALAEHYRLYQDAASLTQIEKLLEFVLFMQEPDGEFRNFIAKNPDGTCYKKDSASSYKAFSYWASRGYMALAYGYEALGNTNPELSARLKSAMELCATRIDQLVGAKYGQYAMRSGYNMPQWNLAGDNWVSTVAIYALAKHNEQFPQNAVVKTNIQRLGEALSASAFGNYQQYPLGGLMHMYGDRVDQWDEWGSTQIAALALAGKICSNTGWIEKACLAADSFLSDLMISGRAFAITPNKVLYPQINYASASYVDNFIKLYEVTGQEKYAQMAGIAATWWMGNNSSTSHTPMFSQEYGAAFDGIVSADTVSLNSGAESVVEAIRVLARVLQYAPAKELLTSVKTDRQLTATTIELEDLYTLIPDEQKELPGGGLNDKTQAIITKLVSAPGLNENVIQTPQTVLPEAVKERVAEVYPGWMGKNAFFCEGTGHDNVRIYKDGYLTAQIPVGGSNQLQAGDYVKLDFMVLLQFDTVFRASIYAVDAQGHETLLGDDSAMQYNNRTWYSGDNSIKTKAIAPIPAGSDHLEVRFTLSTTATSENYGKSYVTLTQAKLFKMNTPEVQSGGNEYSGGKYAKMESLAEKTFSHEVLQDGAYDMYVSIGNQEIGDPVAVSITSGTQTLPRVIAPTAYGTVQIVRLGRLVLEEGVQSITVRNDGTQEALVDAIILYPVRTFAEYRTQSGQLVQMVRDSGQ